MAHHIETTDNMAYVGDVPWHGLGAKLPDGATVEQMRQAAGLTWDISKEPMFIKGNFPVRDHFALVRSDNHATLDVVGRQYIPVSPANALDFFNKFALAGDLVMETAGSLCDGRYVWGLARSPVTGDVAPRRTGGGQDTLKNYVLLVSPNIHGKTLIVKQTSVRVVCWNTMTAALASETAQTFTMRHTVEFDKHQKELAEEVVGLSQGTFKEFLANARKLAGTPMKFDDQMSYLERVFGLNPPEPVEGQGEPRRSPMLNKFIDALNRAPGSQLGTAKDTLWGAFNAVTYMTDHTLSKSADVRLRESWLGYREKTKEKAMKLALELVD